MIEQFNIFILLIVPKRAIKKNISRMIHDLSKDQRGTAGREFVAANVFSI